MTHDDIDGWFDFHPLYDEAIAGARAGAVFVEVGCWLGKSIVYMAERVRMLHRPIRIVAIDNFAGSSCDGLDQTAAQYAAEGDPLIERFKRNLRKCEVDHMIQVCQCDSIVGASLFSDSSVDFVFIDADHRQEAVRADVMSWYPKLRPGGLLCGHDYNRDEVRNGLRDGLIAMAPLGADRASWDHAFTGCPTSFMYVKPGG